MRPPPGNHAARRALALAAFGVAAALFASPARADPPDPSRYVDPAYEPAAHGGLPYATYLRLTRGGFRRSTGMMVTGIVLVSVGATTMAVGSSAYAAASGCNDQIPNLEGDFGQSCSSRTGHATGMAILLAGSIAAGLGIPLWIVGATDVPWAESAANERVPARLGLVPAITPVAAGRGVALTWQF